MSKKNNQNQTPQQESKVMTKYDRKMQAYQEQEKKARAQKQRGNIIGIAIVVIVAAFVLSFPIRNYMAVNGAYITVGGEKITKVEFDYHYAMARTNFIAQNNYYLSMMGMNASTIDSQMYSTDLTFKDYFEQLAVGNIQNTKAMKAEAQAAGFTYNTDEEYEETIAELRDGAAENSTTFNRYIKSIFGSYATESRLENVIREGILTTAYYEKIAGESEPTEAEIIGYYDENKNNYDVVDYYLNTVSAELPTAAPDGSATLDENGNEVAYQPTEEETAAAMEAAKEEAESALEDMLTQDNFHEAQSYSAVSYLLNSWLFDEARVEGDTTVVEDATNHRYLAASFGGRYRVETPTVDIRAIVTQSMDAQTILDEWNSGAATEESFIELCERYDENGVEDGLYEGIEADSMNEEMNAWLGDAGRQAGDTAAFTDEDGANYVFYYVGTNDPVWKLSIHDLLLNQTMMDYLGRISENITVEDPKGNLNYLKVEAAAQENQENTEEQESSAEDSAEDSTEDTQEDVE
ncbi:MAG: SurA N-terminal domain-containing protein [Acetatifactor sp.]|nr:SurA N-terminal domain-containing protein [Acetatifactor sp.]